MHRRAGAELRLDRRQLGVVVLAEAVGVRLGALGGAAHQHLGIAEQVAGKAARRPGAFQHHVRDEQPALGDQRRCERRPRIPVLVLALRIGIDPLAQAVLGLLLGGQHRRVGQCLQPAGVDLEAVLDAEHLVLGVLRGAGAGAAVFPENAVQGRKIAIGRGQLEITQQLQLGHRFLARGRARIAGGEHQLSILRAGGVEREELRVRRMAVVVRTQERHVEVVAREIEIVRIAAEEGRVLVRREHQPHVLVAAVAVQRGAATMVERDHVATPKGGIAADAGFLDRAFRGLLRAGVVGAMLAGERRVHPRRDVADGVEPVELHRRAFRLACLGCRGVAVLHVVVAGAGEFRKALVGAVMVGHHQPVAGHERRRAAECQAGRGLRHPLDPVGRRREAVLRLHLLHRQVVHRPHAFLGMGGGSPWRCDQERGEHAVSQSVRAVSGSHHKRNDQSGQLRQGQYPALRA